MVFSMDAPGSGLPAIVSVIGLGKVGASMLAAYASKGHRLIGVDVNPQAVELINAGQPPVREKDLDGMLREHRARIAATRDTRAAVHSSSISFIIVPTPSAPDGSFSLEYVSDAARSIGKALADRVGYHLVVLTSTVLPGDSERVIIPLLEQNSGKRCGVDFGYCYSPAFIALGSVIRDLLTPDFFLIGESDERAGALLESFYRTIGPPANAVERMSVASAEVAKIALNAYVTQKITFANALGEFASAVPGVDVDKVTEALGKDRRIGRHYLRAGLGYGGPCFPRDNRAFSRAAARYGVSLALPGEVDRYNRGIAEKMFRTLFADLDRNLTVGVLGVAYKPDTPVVEESQGLELAQRLLKAGFRLAVYDPLAMEEARQALGTERVRYCATLTECLEISDVYFLSHPAREFETIVEFVSRRAESQIGSAVGRELETGNVRLASESSLARPAHQPQPKIVIDPWRQLRALAALPQVTYIPFGIHRGGRTQDA